MTPQSLVIDLAEARRSRGLPSARPHPTLSPRTFEDAPDEAPPPLFEGGVQDLSERVAEAMADWAGHEMTSPLELMTLLPSTIQDIGQDPEMQEKTGISRLDRALSLRYGDARLGRAALMTPQEILALDGVGRIALDQLIPELAKHPALSMPELITGRGKAAIQITDEVPEGLLELAAGMPGRAAPF